MRDILTYKNDSDEIVEDWLTFRRVENKYPILEGGELNLWDVDMVQYVSPDENVRGPHSGNGRLRCSTHIRNVYMDRYLYFTRNKKELVILVANLTNDKQRIIRFSVLFVTCGSNEDNTEIYMFDPRTNNSVYGRWQNNSKGLSLEVSLLKKIVEEHRTLKILNLRVKDDDDPHAADSDYVLKSLHKCIDFLKTYLDKGHPYMTYSPTTDYEKSRISTQKLTDVHMHGLSPHWSDTYVFPRHPIFTWSDLKLNDGGRYNRQVHIENRIITLIPYTELKDMNTHVDEQYDNEIFIRNWMNTWYVDVVYYALRYRYYTRDYLDDTRLVSPIYLANTLMNQDDQNFSHENAKEEVILVACVNSNHQQIVRFCLLILICDEDVAQRQIILFDPRRKVTVLNDKNLHSQLNSFVTQLSLRFPYNEMLVVNNRSRRGHNAHHRTDSRYIASTSEPIASTSTSTSPPRQYYDDDDDDDDDHDDDDDDDDDDHDHDDDHDDHDDGISPEQSLQKCIMFVKNVILRMTDWPEMSSLRNWLANQRPIIHYFHDIIE